MAPTTRVNSVRLVPLGAVLQSLLLA